ncbi:MAG: hypothetical protein JGK24_20765 [Microcoleus sp. PH2017_29_MFU_D_A]|uniref:hypothetical protein n=1 Tax=unclassified Microcoleus TaxID=2642155 RepID=UPI001DCC714B|nr:MULTISPECIES: hypothetical protein [unclassified Microcoleus]MCC3417867.1 hypothetical protein [Microcoleus sp. PH2017_07_MST_O_A]MCC3432803.1 hypothetical protein [Microcoleus sp. PH2017_04_SCI_O_A]MCC3465311.1 hypothetical protein [Microcoleus sp. PH2017_06_SFM_O_A]MCC3512999.1 hypothetical protein [Microcoleus sp. PH2017_17_BER_D_A]MCC3414763.1 hypothetical protein [Microcoleus sp. PH2017_02_FOX_O_A]
MPKLYCLQLVWERHKAFASCVESIGNSRFIDRPSDPKSMSQSWNHRAATFVYLSFGIDLRRTRSIANTSSNS